MNPHQIHEAESDLASAALRGNTGQSNVPSYLSAVLVCSSFSDVGGNAKGNGVTASVTSFGSLW